MSLHGCRSRGLAGPRDLCDVQAQKLVLSPDFPVKVLPVTVRR